VPVVSLAERVNPRILFEASLTTRFDGNDLIIEISRNLPAK
jgi:hypothetical protein